MRSRGLVVSGYARSAVAELRGCGVAERPRRWPLALRNLASILALALLVVASNAMAQGTEPPAQPQPSSEQTPDSSSAVPPSPSGEVFASFVNLGFQIRDVDTRSSKFLEYRDVPEGLSGPSLRVSGITGNTLFRISGENLSQEDRRVRVYADHPLVWLDLTYDQIPHRFGFDARSIETRVSRDVWGVADTTQRQFQTGLESVARSSINFNFLRGLVEPALNTASVFDVELQRHRTNLALRLFPEAQLDTHITYFQENRHGNRGAGTSFGFSNVVETPEPTEFRTRDVGLSAEYPIKNGLIRGMLRVNEFENDFSSYMFDNPFRLVSSTDASAYQAPGTASINGPSFGRIALPPDNRALNLAGGITYKLPYNSRINADLVVGRWKQNETFIPMTTNVAIPEAQAVTLPRTSLDGKINTTSFNAVFTTRPFKAFNITARLRHYDLDNETPRFQIPGYVRFDASWNPSARVSVPYSWTNDRAEVAASYDFRLLTIEGGLRRETMERTFRETGKTTEDILHLAADFKPAAWATVRASVEFGERDFDEYDFERSEDASFVVAPSAPGNLPQLRRFDQAKRDTSRAVAMIQLTPLDSLTIALNGVHFFDDYDDESDYGLLTWRTDSYTAEVDYTPTNRVTLFGYFTRDNARGFQRGRQSAATVSVNPLDDWTASNSDKSSSFGLGATFGVVPDKVDVRLSTRYQNVNGNADLFSPPGGTPDVAVPIPQVDDTRLVTTSAELLYRLAERWDVSVGGWIERYRIRDAQSSGTQPYMPGGFFLAENNGDYKGNVAFVRATFRF